MSDVDHLDACFNCSDVKVIAPDKDTFEFPLDEYVSRCNPKKKK